MALPNMVAEKTSQSSVASSNSGFPKYDETDPEGTRRENTCEIVLNCDQLSLMKREMEVVCKYKCNYN